MFCPKCRSEFEAGYTRCAACDADLVESLPVDDEEYTGPLTIFASDSCLYDNPSVIKEYTDLNTVFEGEEGAAELVRARLKSCGIEAWLQTESYLRIVGPNLAPTRVKVRAEDAEAACKALEEVIPLDEDTAIDTGEDPGDEA